jgi:hypothetical protein
MITTHTPITGQEAQIDPGEPRGALAEFYRTFKVRDLALMQQNWDSTGEASMDNPLGKIRRGGPRSVPPTSACLAALERSRWSSSTIGNGFLAVGRDRGQCRMDDVTLDLAIRTSRIFRRVGGRWRQLHHHVSTEDPDLLALPEGSALTQASAVEFWRLSSS